MPRSLIEESREFLKDTIRQRIDFSQTDQNQGVAAPPLEKPFAAEATRIKLLTMSQWSAIGEVDVLTAIANRQSWRAFSGKPLSLEEISFLLWATQGIRRLRDAASALRTVPSAGARHALETYLCVLNCEGLESTAVYRYLPVEHELLLEFCQPELAARLVEATLGQSFIGKSAATFVWTTVAYRMEWRYGPASHKVIALDAGHVCQNLYLACEAIEAGTCAVAAYHQQLMDRLVRVDGAEEFVVYLAPVGKKNEQG
jgi:SagB-type dehydrogenase family enzyme